MRTKVIQEEYPASISGRHRQVHIAHMNTCIHMLTHTWIHINKTKTMINK